MAAASPGGPAVVAVVVAHASRTRLRETLRSLGAQSAQDLTVVVAAVGPLEVPEGEGLPECSVVRVSDPAGFADAVRVALAEVEGADYVLLLHDDVSLHDDAVAELVATAESDPAIAAVGAKLMEWDRPDVLQEVGASIDRFGIRRSALDAGEVDAGQRDDTSDVLFSSDACLLVRRSALEAVGGMDAAAWPFYEDVDLCWRLRAAGHRVVVAPRARARHAADLSRGRRLFDAITLREHAERGRLRFMLKHYAPLGLIVLLPQVLVASAARLLSAVVRRELWRVRVIFNSWVLVGAELPSILRERRRTPRSAVDDRELLALAGRSAVADVRGERAEWISRFLAGLGRTGERLTALARDPVAWAWVAAAVVVIVVMRDALFARTFALGEVRPAPPLGDAITDHFARVRREGLDPFGPGTPGLLVVAFVRSVIRRAALAEKVLLLLPLWLAGASGARLGRTLGLRGAGPGWLAIAAAVNPVTLTLLADGSLGALALWSALLWLAAGVLAPAPRGEGIAATIRYTARWALGWAVAVALHPPALPWMLGLGLVVAYARRADEHTRGRLRILATGAGGAFVLLLPWSLEWFSRRSPLVGRPGWLVSSGAGGLESVALGAGWPLLAGVALALAAAFFVGNTRTTFGLVVLLATAAAAHTTGAFGRDTSLAVIGACALMLVAIVARRILDDLPSYELGLRHAAVIGSVIATGAIFLGGVITTVGSSRVREMPVVSADRSETGRVLWLAETTGGLRTWVTLSFSERLGAFPGDAGPAQRLVSRAVEAARDDRTHRLGGVLALADISHVVALDAASARGLDDQADIGRQESQRGAVVYRNEAWRGPAMLLAASPSAPLSATGLADVVRDTRRLRVDGWPYGPLRISPPSEEDALDSGVVYLASGVRGGVRFEGASGRIVAAGAAIPAGDMAEVTADGETLAVSLPGAWWRWLLPVQVLLVSMLLAAWFAAAYVGGPAAPLSEVTADLFPVTGPAWRLAAAPVVIAFVIGLGWLGPLWGVGGPFLSSAWYCPPIGRGYEQSLGIVNPSGEEVEYLVRDDLAEPPKREGTIGRRARETVGIAADQGAVVESYGRRLAVATEVLRLGDRDASLCARSTRETNVFPDGGRFATRAQPRLFERYILFNPFPDLARASVRFVSPDESLAPPDLQDIRVEPGKFVVVDPEQEFEPMPNLSTVVRVWQGRAIVARRLRTEEQVTFSLPVQPRSTGVLPRAQTQDAVTAIIAVNTGDESARATVFGAGGRGSLPEESFTVPDGSRSEFDLNAIAPDASQLVVGVRSDRPVYLESLVAPDDRRTGVSLFEPQTAEREWVIPIAERRELVVVNPNPRAVRVEVERLGPAGAEIEPFTIEPSRTARIPLPAGAPYGVVVRSRDGAITAAAVGGRGSLAGIPIR